MPTTLSTIDALREAMQDETKQAPEAVVASLDAEVKATEGENRSLTFTISTPNVDRGGDTIALSGWKLDRFKQNPVVLWGHDPLFPVGKATKVWKEDGKLKAIAKFAPSDNPAFGPLAEGLFRMYAEGFLKATSVGFQPIKYNFTDDPERKFGIDFTEQELLEFSLVTIPANAEALIDGKKAGINVEPLIETLITDERLLDLAERVVARKDLFARAFVEKLATVAGVPVITAERQKKIELIERHMTQERLRKKRERRVRAMQFG